ncbi:PREDICTED: tumor necrosis factor alpha-induced protein 2 [Elephantulus edwardii]|uniref:tumor necrosis factor alpha-induced protein 2 n=1 Tax=Elephantulus edwardii TaxID=28737 RepID=UPI0003F0ED77|nr:PREDICTED: tumor necrosis factor alpha-induced protein 2 [Elephantulus edwardii]
MLKMMTFFQGLPGERPVPGALDFSTGPKKLPSTSEGESEASVSEASSEDLVPSLERAGALDEEGTAKKKKSKGLATMFGVFKGKKKKGQSSSEDPEATPKPSSEHEGRLPTVEELKAQLERGQLEAARPLLALERELLEAAAGGAESAEELVRRQSKVEALYALLRDQVLGALRRPLEAAPERLRQALAVVAEQERSEAERTFLHMGRTMKEDLEAVVQRLKPLFPAEFHVVAAYAESYHQHFAAHMAAMAKLQLDKRDTYMLLLWVQNLYPNDIINSPNLAGELQGVKLGSLLPPRQIRLLEATFLSNELTSVKELMARALELESQHWAQDVPPQILNGHCHSELAIDVIQIVSQGQAKAENISAELGGQMRQLLLVELAAFLRSYQSTFAEFLERGRQKRNYRDNVIANINNCLSFRTSMVQRWQSLQDTHSHMLRPLDELKTRGFDVLLQSLFLNLKPLFKRFTQTRWAAPAGILEEILTVVAQRLPEFLGLQECLLEELVGVVHLHLVKEYIIRLSKRRLVLKTPEQQQLLAQHVLNNADHIQSFCAEKGSKATWLDPALPKLAEIIRLQDPSAIKIEVATYATLFPDFSKDHLSAILAIKGNLSSSEVRGIRNILDVNIGSRESTHSLFSLIKIG